MRILHFILGSVFYTAVSMTSVYANDVAWQSWREGSAVLILRHALAPGTGDPAQFMLGDCATQRNLNQRGREQAQQWGRLLLTQASRPVQVYSSEWCRCMETATLMAVGNVLPLASLNSFFADRGLAEARTRAIQQDFAVTSVALPTVLVTHQVNITALTGLVPQSAEGIFVALPLSVPAKVIASIQID